jgi:hypothetical protein
MAGATALGCALAHGEELSLAYNSNQASTNFESRSNLTLAPPASNGIWVDDTRESLRRGAIEFEASFGAGLGIRDSRAYQHDLALAEFRLGRVVSETFGKGHWYRGNFEIFCEAFVGSQFNPSPRYFVGAGPVLRYESPTGTRWVPFLDLSLGLTGTAIGHPDLGANFEFDLQGGPGVKYYFRDNMAFIFQYRYLHFSNAGLFPHNHGINANVLLLGASWAF